MVVVVSKPVPVMVTVVPVAPLVGEKLVIDGITVKFDDEVAVWLLTVTLIGPVVAPDGTVVTISVLVELVTTAAVPLKLTALFAAVVSKFAPTMVTVVPAVPLAGEKLEMLGDDVVLPQPDRIIWRSKATRAKGCLYPYDLNIMRFLSRLMAYFIKYRLIPVPEDCFRWRGRLGTAASQFCCPIPSPVGGSPLPELGGPPSGTATNWPLISLQVALILSPRGVVISTAVPSVLSLQTS